MSSNSNAPTIAFELIGPNEARDLLEANPRNRNVRQERVDQYARDMRAGRWLTTGEPIQVADDGTLLNGQHRLLAIVQANVAITLLVMRDVPVGYQRVADSGLKRTFADVLKIEFGETQVSSLAATVRHIHRFRITGVLGEGGGIFPTINELVDTYLREPGLREALPIGDLINDARLATPNSLAAALYYLCDEADHAQAEPFFRQVASGEMIAPGDPIWALRRVLGNVDHRRGLRQRPSATLLAALYIKGFNFWREGRPVKTLVWKPFGPAGEDFPRILRHDEIVGDDDDDEA